MRNFIPGKEFPIEPPIKCKVYQDYDKLDNVAVKAEYKSIEPRDDIHIETTGHVGMQNASLHCGWIATMGDNGHNPIDQIKMLNEKVKTCIENGESVKVGFCQTGNFSIGYSIYRKGVHNGH